MSAVLARRAKPRMNWKVVALADAAEIVNGGTPKSKVARYWGGDVQWLTPKDMGQMEGREIATTPRTISKQGLASSSARLVPSNSVILSTRAPIGHLAVNTVPMAFNQGCRGIVPNPSLDTTFLYYFLLANKQQLDDLGSGTTFKELSASNLKSVRLPLPPLEEQKRIVAVLDQAFAALDRARANAEANLADAQELQGNTLDAAFRDLARPDWIKPLADAVHPDCKLSYGIVQPGDDVDGGLPVVRPVDLKTRVITADTLKRIGPKRAAGYARTQLVGGELLLCVRGSTGEVSVASADLAGCNVTRGIVPIRFDATRVLPEFAYFQFRSRFVREQIAAKTYGAALMQINIKDLRELAFVVPPIAQQREAVALAEQVFDVGERLRGNYEMGAADLAALRQSLLQKAFAGELA